MASTAPATNILNGYPIRNYDTTDPGATAWANDIKGGHHQYQTLAQRNAITVPRRAAGMTCHVLDTGITYVLGAGLGNGDWTDAAGGVIADVAALEADVAVLDGEVSALDADVTSLDGNVSALNTRVGVAETEIDSLQAATANGHKGYLTQSALYADLTPAAGTLGEVTNDSDPDKNGTYIKIGGTGTGSWTQSNSGLNADVIVLKEKTELQGVLDPGLETADAGPLVLALRDSERRVAVSLASDGLLSIGEAAIRRIRGPLTADSYDLDGASIETVENAPAWAFLLRDGAGKIGFGLKVNGDVIAPGLPIPSVTPGSVTTELLADGAVTHPKLADDIVRQISNDQVPVMPDDARVQDAVLGLYSGTNWQTLPREITPIVEGANNSGTSLDFRPSSGLLVAGQRKIGTFNASTPGPSTTYRGTIRSGTTWPPAGTFANGDYYHYTDSITRVIGSDTLRLGDLMVRVGGAWVYKASPASGTTPVRKDWWEVTGAGTYEGITLAVGDRLVFVAYESAGAYGLFRWRKGLPGNGECFRMGSFDPASGLPSSPAEGDLWEISVGGSTGGFTLAVNDEMRRKSGIWIHIPTGTIKTVANGAGIYLRCNWTAAEWEFRRTDKSLTRVGATIAARGRPIPHRSSPDIQGYADSMGDNVFPVLATISGRAVSNRSNPGGTSDEVEGMAEWWTSQGDPDRARTMVTIIGQNNNSNLGQTMYMRSRLTQLMGSSDRRVIHVSVLGERVMVWDAGLTRLTCPNFEEQWVAGSSNNYARDVAALRATWPDNWMWAADNLCNASIGDTTPDPQFPGMTYAQSAAAYHIPAVKYCRGITPADGLDFCINYLGTWSSGTLPTGGSSGDYYIRIDGANAGYFMANKNGTWTPVTYDDIHLNTAGDTIQAEGIDELLIAKDI